jgi:hypothetical protein
MSNTNIELSPALVAELANYSEADRNALMEVLDERASQLSVTWFQQITTYFNFSCFLTY